MDTTPANVKKTFEHLFYEITSGRLPMMADTNTLITYVNNVINTPHYEDCFGNETPAVNRVIHCEDIPEWFDDITIPCLNSVKIPREHLEVVKTYFHIVDQNERYGWNHPLAEKWMMKLSEDEFRKKNCKGFDDWKSLFYWVRDER